MSEHLSFRCPVCSRRYIECLRHQYRRFNLRCHSPWTGGHYRMTMDQRTRFEARLRTFLRDHAANVTGFWEVFEMKKRARADQAKKGEYQAHTEVFFAKCPEITKVLWDCWYDDGSPRELGKLTIGLVPAGVNLAITDPSERMSAFCTADTLKDALKLLEDALAGGGDPWRPWPASFGKKKG